MQKVHTTCETLSQSAQKGTITRFWDTSPALCVFILAILTIALFLGACLVALAMHDRKVARQMNAYIPSERSLADTIVDCVKTRNLKCNR